jgi:glycosyltransferase involved in cell wall biosynthesis
LRSICESLEVKVSIITAVLNGADVVADTLRSITEQDYPNIEHIVVDGGSVDETLRVVSEFGARVSKVFSEKDSGVYDAINRGIAAATGDLILCLHAGDVYEHAGVISRIAREFEDPQVDLTFAELVMTHTDNRSCVMRHYATPNFEPDDFASGLMPAHPTVAIRRRVFDRCGLYDPSYKIAGDFEFLIRAIYLQRGMYRNIPEILVRMPMGGLSNRRWWVPLTTTFELRRACREHGIETYWLRLLYRIVVKWRASARNLSGSTD